MKGEMIDNIENNITSGVEYIEKAKGEIKQAVSLQKNARRVSVHIFNKLIFCLCFLPSLIVDRNVCMPKKEQDYRHYNSHCGYLYTSYCAAVIFARHILS